MSEYTGSQFEIIAKAKQALLDTTNIDTSPDEMKVLDDFLFRCWQMGWLDDYDDTKDVAEVVRCGNCKYGEENCKSPIYGMWCKRFGAEKSNLAVLPIDYCSYGERKEQENEATK